RHYEPHTSEERGRGGQKLRLAHVFLKDCDLPLVDWQPRLSLPANDQKALAEQFGLPTDKMLIAIHTGRTWPVKELPAERWQEIVDELQKKWPCHILHFCSPSRDGGAVHTLQRVQTLPPDLPVTAIAAILSQCRLFIGLDSGLLHLAGAVGIPVIGVFGPTNPRYFLPLNPPAQGISQALPCSFCQHEPTVKHWVTGCPYAIRCMKEISAGQILEIANRVLDLPPNLYIR
ncbi:MAG: glycosyltransferase family 9 protein, partial [Verrucomicrobiota bacterium]